MGWRDGVSTWYSEWEKMFFNLESDDAHPDKADIDLQATRSAFEAGYAKGFEARGNFDPKMDSD